MSQEALDERKELLGLIRNRTEEKWQECKTNLSYEEAESNVILNRLQLFPSILILN